MILSNQRITKALIRLRECAGLCAPLLFAHPEDSFRASRPSLYRYPRSCPVELHVDAPSTTIYYICGVVEVVGSNLGRVLH